MTSARSRGLCSTYPDRQPRCGSDSARTHRPVPLHPQVSFPICPDLAPTSAISAPETDALVAATPWVAVDGRAPVTEYDEQQELEAARERNDLEVSDLREMSVAELRQVSRDLELDAVTGERKDNLVDQILRRQTERAGHDYATGILDIVDEGFGFLRRHGLLPSPEDVYVSSSQVRRFGLRIGDRVSGAVRAPREAEKYWGMLRVDSVNGVDTETARRRPVFGDLTPVHPDVLINLETDPKNLSQRLINLVNPLGKGQRALIVSPPKAGKTMLLKQIANGVSANYPEILLMVALIGERPEEVTDMRRSVKGEVISSTFDEPTENHTHVAEMALEIAKRQVETGRDVVILLDSITRLARAYNLALPPSGRTLSGGLDPIALYPPKRFFGAARNIEEGGSLTIIGTCLVDTGSRMDDVIYEEFKGTGNSELILDRKLAEKRIFPSIDVQRSGHPSRGAAPRGGHAQDGLDDAPDAVRGRCERGHRDPPQPAREDAVERRVPLDPDEEPRLLGSRARPPVAAPHGTTVHVEASSRACNVTTRQLPRPQGPWYGLGRCRKPAGDGRRPRTRPPAQTATRTVPGPTLIRANSAAPGPFNARRPYCSMRRSASSASSDACADPRTCHRPAATSLPDRSLAVGERARRVFRTAVSAAELVAAGDLRPARARSVGWSTRRLAQSIALGVIESSPSPLAPS